MAPRLTVAKARESRWAGEPTKIHQLRAAKVEPEPVRWAVRSDIARHATRSPPFHAVEERDRSAEQDQGDRTGIVPSRTRSVRYFRTTRSIEAGTTLMERSDLKSENPNRTTRIVRLEQELRLYPATSRRRLAATIASPRPPRAQTRTDPGSGVSAVTPTEAVMPRPATPELAPVRTTSDDSV
jgi:hypothetical protein